LDIYHVWCNLQPGVSDLDFVDKTRKYLEHLEADGRLVRHRITRAKLGLIPAVLREFHIMMEFDGLAQLDRAFSAAASRTDPVESFHHAVNSLVKDVLFALYRDFPDPVRERGQEKF
jgi:uncharacterized protein DUF6614